MPRILLVDDEPNIRWTMSEFLSRQGYETLTAGDVDSAISIIETNVLDAAVVDIVLPRRSGIDLLQHLQGAEPFIPVIMITGEPNLSVIPEVVRAGAYDFLAKPVRPDTLVKAVSKAVEQKRLIDEKRRLEQVLKEHAETLETVVRERTRELSEAHSFLNTVLESSTEYAIVSLDLKGRITLFNRGAELLFGCTSEQMLGKSPRNLIALPVQEGNPFLGWAEKSVTTGRHQAEVEFLRADQSSFIGSLTVTPIRQGDVHLLGHLAIIKDLTAEKQNEEWVRQLRNQLAHQEKIAALGRMAAQVAHEVKNPLAGLRLYSLHLKSKVGDGLGPGEMSLIDKIIAGINHLSESVDRVMGFARPITLTRRRVELAALIAESAQLLEPQLSANNIEFNAELSETATHASLDEASMRSTLINLMLNSIQAMPGGGRLRVITEPGDEAVCFTVSDTGCGMSGEQIESIFEPFYTTRSQGLGLGLSYAKKVIEQHGGAISVDSRLNEGTRIKITIPLEEGTIV
jgi:PAS domain S-box-containing protein